MINELFKLESETLFVKNTRKKNENQTAIIWIAHTQLLFLFKWIFVCLSVQRILELHLNAAGKQKLGETQKAVAVSKFLYD